MININAINEILSAVGLRDGIEGLLLDRHGVAGLRLQDDTHLFFEWREKTGILFIYIPLLTLPDEQERRRELCEKLFGLNCLASPSMALHAPSSRVLLQLGLDAARLTTEVLDRALDTLTAEYKNLLLRIGDENAAASPPGAIQPATSMSMDVPMPMDFRYI